MIRNILLIILVIVIGFLLFNKFSSKNSNESVEFVSETEVAPVEWKVFKDRTGGYEVSYPKGWLLVSKSNENGMIRADISKSNEAGLQIRKYSIGNQSSDVFVQSYLGTFIEEMESHWSGKFTQLSYDKRDLPESNYYRVEYSFLRGDGQKWFFIEYVWVQNQMGITFQCGIEDRLVEKYRGEFDLIADSFRFTN